MPHVLLSVSAEISLHGWRRPLADTVNSQRMPTCSRRLWALTLRGTNVAPEAMSETNKRTPGERAMLFIARVALWPAAKIWPRSAWGRFYKRIVQMQGGVVRNDTSSSRSARVSSNQRRLLGVLALAAVLWLIDMIRKHHVSDSHSLSGRQTQITVKPSP